MAPISAPFHLILLPLLGILLSPCNGDSNPKVDIKQVEDEVHADITTKDGQINLRFKRAAGIFSPEFKINGHYGNAQEWIDFEKNVMVADNGAVAHIEDDEMKSLVDHHNEVFINPHDFVDRANQKVQTKIVGKSERISDYVDLGLKTTVDPTLRRTRGPPIISVKPEVHIVIVMAFYKQFRGDDNAVRSYLSMFLHAVNNRYQTLANPKISFVITGLTILKQPTDQPFIEVSRIRQYNYKEVDIHLALPEFSKWTHNMQLSKTADLVALISAEAFMDKNSAGKYTKGITGIAYVGGACVSIDEEWVNGGLDKGTRYLGTSVNSDQGARWGGVFLLAHELAHNLNANHDENSAKPQLPASCQWNQGYLMSYMGWGTPNKFKFSPCSANSMAQYATTVEGQCLRTQAGSEVPWNVNIQPGETKSMDVQCRETAQRIGGFGVPPRAIWKGDFTAQNVCLTLSCTATVFLFRQIRQAFQRVIPLDETPCNAQGNYVCRNGSCVPK